MPITLSELHLAIHKNLKNASSGPDNIHASMLKNLHPNSTFYLLSLFNNILSQGVYPLPWKLAIILPFLKPAKDPSFPNSYHPIALTSVLGKLFQKILTWFLDFNNLLSHFQYGFRKNRNTLQALTDLLQQQINNAVNKNSSLYTIFFDLQQAFPRVWRHYICQKLHLIGLRDNLSKLLQSFLHDRSITVRIEDQLSSHQLIQNGVPQGEVWSVPLFLILLSTTSVHVSLTPSHRDFSLMTSASPFYPPTPTEQHVYSNKP